MKEIKASIKNSKGEMDIEFYENNKLIFEMDCEELLNEIHRAIIEELDRKDHFKIYD